ncbi:MAG: hypothetical protein WAO28_03320 [Candidatus Microsaccharimonas sp.]
MTNEASNKKRKAPTVVRVIITVFVSVLLLLSAVVLVGTLTQINDLINPVSVLLPLLMAIIFDIGLIFVLVGTWQKQKLLNKKMWIGIIAVVVALPLFFVASAVNKQIFNETISSDLQSLREYKTGGLSYEMPTSWATKTGGDNTYFYPSRTVDDTSEGMIMVRSDYEPLTLNLSVCPYDGILSGLQEAEDFKLDSETDTQLLDITARRISYSQAISGEMYQSETFIVCASGYISGFTFVYKNKFPSYFQEIITSTTNTIKEEEL